MERKICPLSFSSPEGYDLCECKEEKCAWWTKDEYEMCAIVRIAKEIQNLIPPRWVGGAK